jgi:hypothetical protein
MTSSKSTIGLRITEGACRPTPEVAALALKLKKVKKLPEWQAYARLYYDNKLKDIIEKKHEKEYIRKFPNCNHKDIPAPGFMWWNAQIQCHYKKETPTVVQQVKSYHDELQPTGVGPMDLGLEDEQLEARKLTRKYQ